MSASRSLLRRNVSADNKRTILGRKKAFRRVLGARSIIAETGDGRHRHATRLHATKGWLTWRVPLRWRWSGPGSEARINSAVR